MNLTSVEDSVFYDQGPESMQVLEEVLIGMSKQQKSLPAKLLYDKRGSEIFEELCDIPEYYPTRAEKEILSSYASEMSKLVGPRATILEPGSGNGEKVRYLLEKLEDPECYIPVEISKEMLLKTTEDLMKEYPRLNVIPICADFTDDFKFSVPLEGKSGKIVIFFPGSTIGNLSPQEAISFLKKCGEHIPREGGMIIGVDQKKDQKTLRLAYDDPAGVTASFNLNLLERLNRELDATFQIENFCHEAHYNEKEGRIEMHLRSTVDQMVKIRETTFHLGKGETIHTENSYKYAISEFSELCAKANFALRKVWHDSQNLFSVYYFEKSGHD